MTSIKIRGISLIFIFCVCFNVISKAQIKDQDSTVNKQNRLINVAYGTQPAWLVSGAISSVNGSELQKSFASKLSNTLFGRLPGLTVVQGSGEAGNDSPSLYGRGINTFGTGRNLLIIVDGYESSFEHLIPEEIESANLLKDATATALYGSRGANGVLLVNTKRGTINKMIVNFSTQLGFQKATHLPEFLGSYDYASLYNEGLINDGNAARYKDSDLEAYRTGSDPFFHPDVNWYDEVLRKSAPVSNYNLSFRGGSEGVRYFVLANVLNRQGLFKKTKDLSEFSFNANYRKYNLRTNFDVSLSKSLTAEFSVGASIDKQESPAGNTASSIFNLMATVPPNAFPARNPNGTYGGSGSLYSNPLGDVMEKGLFTGNARAFQVRGKLTQKLDIITKGLSISGAGSYDDFIHGYLNRTRNYPMFSISKDALGNTIYTKIGQGTSLASGTFAGDLAWRNYSVQAFLNYNRTFGRHLVDAMLLGSVDNNSVDKVELAYKHNKMAGRLTYSNNEKYIGEFCFAYMGSENFKKGRRYGFFPAGSLAWIASNEDFLKENKILNYLKIRGSYGIIGNDVIGGQRFMFDQYYPSTSSYYFGTSNTSMASYIEGSAANPNVTWEKEKKINIGFEATILKRLDFALDIFQQDRFDILAKPYRTVPKSFGMILPDLNVGKVRNKGFEAMIRYERDPSKDLQFSLEANVWYAKNKIVFNSEIIQLFDYLYRTGYPINQPFMLEAIGFFKDQSDITSSPHQTFAVVQPGDLKYKDQNNDNIIDQNDYYPIGKTSVPELTAGFNTGIKYKNFDLELFIQGVSGRSVYLSGNYFEAFQNNGKVSSIALGRWTKETAATATYPRVSASNNLNNFQPSSFWQRDGSFIKLRSVEIGYNLSKEVVNRIKLDNARVFINGTNLLSLDHMDFTDPETITDYPAVRTWSFGARIQF